MKQQTSHTWWRTVLTGLLIAVAAIALVGTLITRYVQRNVLDTNGYLAIVGPLPENPTVAAALAQFTTSKAFDAVDAERNLKQFLPPKLAPLAGPLADTLQKRFTQRTQNFIQGDAFSAIWTTANRAMQKGVVRLAQSKAGQGKLAAVGSLDLSALVSKARERFGGNGAGLTSEQQAKAANVQINLRQRTDRLRTAYKATNSGAYALPYMAAAALTAAVAVSNNRRRAITAIGITILLVTIGVLLAFKIISGNLLNEVTNQTSKAAAKVIYEAFYGDLRSRLVAAAIAGIFLVIVALLAGPYAWAHWLRNSLGLTKLKTTEPYNWAASVRRVAARYELWLFLAGAVATTIWLLVLSALTPATLVVILSLFVLYSSLLHLMARPAPARTVT